MDQRLARLNAEVNSRVTTIDRSKAHANDPSYVRAFLAALAQSAVQVEELRYARPKAHGDVHAYRFTPKGSLRGAVVYAHATGNDALFAQLHLFHALLARSYQVFSFDLDGHGRHSTTTLAPESAPSSVNDAIAAAASATDAHLIGQSLGGSLLLNGLARGGLRARSLTLISAPTALAPGLADLPGEVWSLKRPAFRAQLQHYGATGLIPSFGPINRGVYPLRLASAGANYIKVVTGLVNDLHLERVTTSVPTLLVYGTADRIVDVAQARALAQTLPRARLIEVPGATHMTTPYEPGAVAAIARFLQENDA